MKPLDKVKRIFLEALDKETDEEREAYLSKACQDDSGFAERGGRLT